MITLVTSRVYLLCERINHIIMQAEYEQTHRHNPHSGLIVSYNIYISFTPLASASHSQIGDEERQMIVKVHGEKHSQRLYNEIVTQLREQLPDQMYLDKMLDKILSGENDIHDDLSTTTLSRARKTKNERKNVLRAPRRSSKKRSK